MKCENKKLLNGNSILFDNNIIICVKKVIIKMTIQTQIQNSKDEGNNKSTVKASAVWEEALVQEFIYAIGHLNHAEQHLIESDSYAGMPVFGDLVNAFREQRKTAGQVMFMIEKLEASKMGNEELRSSWESIWCALKHSATALIHIDECIEKLLQRAKESSSPEYLEGIKSLLTVRENLLKGIVSMIERSKAASKLLTEASVRCRDDLCLEEESH